MQLVRNLYVSAAVVVTSNSVATLAQHCITLFSVSLDAWQESNLF